MSGIVERVARAICSSTEADDYDRLPDNSVIRACYLQKARAAIAAMREPNHRMTVAGHSALDETEYTQTKALGSLMGRMAFCDVWNAMIDAALEDTK